MRRPDLEALQERARRDDWHHSLVGSDLREVIAYARALEAELDPHRAAAQAVHDTPSPLYEADHPYYCATGCYWASVRVAALRYASWAAFFRKYDDADVDMNLIWRWDWIEDELTLYMMHQRHARPTSHTIRVTHEDEPAIRAYLAKHWARMQEIWAPFTCVTEAVTADPGLPATS